jgi:hypothetical protein
MALLNILTNPKNFIFYGGAGYPTPSGNAVGGVNGTDPLLTLKYGKDTKGGGASKQPFIVTPIPGSSATFNVNGLVIARSETDVTRLAKFFTTTPGVLFIAKQNVLSQTNVRTQAADYNNPKIQPNNGPYLPTNTLAQVGTPFFGHQFYKQGLLPDGYFSPKYADNDVIIKVKGADVGGAGNRLVDLTKEKVNQKSEGLNILTYKGGPGAFLGIGSTNIQFASSGEFRTGINNPALLKIGFFSTAGVKNPNFNLSLDFNAPPLILKSEGFASQDEPEYILQPVEALGFKAFTRPVIKLNKDFLFKLENSPSALAKQFNGGGYIDGLNLTAGGASLFDKGTSVYQPGQGFAPSPLASANNTNVYNQEQIVSASSDSVSYGVPKLVDFRKTLITRLTGVVKDNRTEVSSVISKAPDYSTENIEQRVKLGNPGRSNKNIISYTKGAVTDGKVEALDKINAYPLYRSIDVYNDTNDLVKFRIEAIDNNDPAFSVFIHFRAFIDSFSDSYTADWTGTQYVGRGEKFHTYNNFDRTINMSWTVAAQSKDELIPMYQKLNFLASNLMPDYSGEGYMRGPLVRLTVGGYLYSQPGFITSLTYDIPQESPWEIGITDNDTAGSDNTVKELSHMIKVSTFTFTPIHNFVPRKQINTYGSDTRLVQTLTDKEGGTSYYYANNVTTFGDQRFIALAAGAGTEDNNYDWKGNKGNN